MMTANQLNKLMAENDLRQLDLSELFDRTTRQVRRWQKGVASVPVAEMILLRIIERGILSAQQLAEIRDAKKPRRKAA